MPEIQEVLPKYLQIAAHIRGRITRGDLKPGEEVDSERRLAQQWNVARPTAAKALEALRVEGLIESRPGSGNFVRSTNMAPHARDRYERARDQGTMYADGETPEFLSAELVPAPQHVLDALQVASETTAVRRVRLLRNAGGQPIELSISWFAPELAERAPRLLELERLRGGTGKYLGEVIGRAPSYGRDLSAARLATAEERQVLELGDTAAVLEQRRIIFDADDQPLQFDEAVYPPGRWVPGREYPLSR
jgi:DNA-binding GntR family transcriptional regulator